VTAAGGLTLGADPIANALSLISYQLGRPIKPFIVRKDAKGHGTKNKIEGNVKAGERVAVIDDVATTGASTITAIESAREAGLVVERAVVLIDGRGRMGKSGSVAGGPGAVELGDHGPYKRKIKEKAVG
jgi:orotate phosphoribosyltransferase